MAIDTIVLKAAANAPLEASPSFVLAGAWINILLYSVEFLIASYYLFQTPGRKAKALVAVTLMIDTVGTVSICQYTWVVLVTPHKSIKAVAESFLVTSTTSTLSGAITQSYFAYRAWTITRSRIAVLILGTLILIPLGCILASIISASILGTAVDRDKLVVLNILATILGASTDVIVAVYLVFKLRSINLLQFSYPTKCLIRKIMVYTVACGCVTAFFTLFTTTLAFVNVGVFLLFFDCNGRVYTLTILLNFLLFHGWRRDYDEKRRSLRTDNHTDFRWKGSTWSRRFRSSQSSTSTPRFPPSALKRSRSSVSVMRLETHGAVVETFQKPAAGPPFSMESIFSKSNEDLELL
ncbi:hypothetical protein J3R30DRAFT_3502167 [Lentinula aciculospora]|uniref:Transmembrane protein n=1 Tax=Lentinula aciculospora TaxID=153920 RepID=A0A9W9DM67_9AGAR|nr:hypothetical protein J3R30DRAFT_3502167 [Lentinula aciculospora]